jgi:hypothetical protein
MDPSENRQRPGFRKMLPCGKVHTGMLLCLFLYTSLVLLLLRKDVKVLGAVSNHHSHSYFTVLLAF